MDLGGLILTLAILGALGWLTFLVNQSRVRRRREAAPQNLSPFLTDDELETDRLSRVLVAALVATAVLAIVMPIYYLNETARQAHAAEVFDEIAVERGHEWYLEFQCGDCHGADGGGGGASFIEPRSGISTTWAAPALDDVLYRYDEDEVRYWLVFGRQGTPMPAWGVEGGGPMNTQQIDNLIAYMKSIQIPRENCAEGEDPLVCDSGNLPGELQADVQAAAQRAVDDGEAESIGEALFNLELGSGAYSCARCHSLGWSYGQPGVSGQGAFGWNLTGGSVNSHFADDEQLVAFLKNGSEFGKVYGLNGQGSGRMPGFGSLLTDEQIREIVEYVRSL